MQLYEIPVSMLRQYLFCPRIIHFKIVRNLTPEYPFWVEDGQREHQHREELIKKRSPELLKRYQGKLVFNLPLRSRRYDLFGVVDGALIGPQYVIPIEFKQRLGAALRGALMQLIGYGLVLEDIYQVPFSQAIILAGKNGRPTLYKIGDAERSKCLTLIQEIKDVIDSPLIPESSASAPQCQQCEYLNFCGDRNCDG